jgi:dipeptidyl aminopeptidase/acylaminoacyl peptidase
MLLGFHYSSYYANAYAMNQYLASRGFIVLSLNYRSGIGYGLDFREAIDFGASGASEVRDLIGAGQYLKDRADVDASRIALWGGSYGGYLTAHGLSQAPDLFACGVDIHGVHNWNDEIPTFAPWYDPAKMPEFARKAFESSPEYHVRHWKGPVLMIHGDDDRNVPFNETVRFAEILRKQGVPMEELVLPDEVHGFLLHRSWMSVYQAAASFLERMMK